VAAISSASYFLLVRVRTTAPSIVPCDRQHFGCYVYPGDICLSFIQFNGWVMDLPEGGITHYSTNLSWFPWHGFPFTITAYRIRYAHRQGTVVLTVDLLYRACQWATHECSNKGFHLAFLSLRIIMPHYRLKNLENKNATHAACFPTYLQLTPSVYLGVRL